MNAKDLCSGATAASHLHLCGLSLWVAQQIRNGWAASEAHPTCRDYCRTPLRQMRRAMRHKAQEAILHCLTAVVLLRSGALR